MKKISDKDFISAVYELALGYYDKPTKSRDSILYMLYKQKYFPQTNINIKLDAEQTERLMFICQWILDYDENLPNRDGSVTNAVVNNAEILSRRVNNLATERKS